MAQPFGIGDMVAGRYRITQHVLTSADQDIVFQAQDEVLDRPVNVLLAARPNAKQVATSAKELAVGERRSDVQVLDLGVAQEQTYLVSSLVDPNQLLDLVVPDTVAYVEPHYTDSLGSELFGQSREMQPQTFDDDAEYYSRLKADLKPGEGGGRFQRRRPAFLDKIVPAPKAESAGPPARDESDSSLQLALSEAAEAWGHDPAAAAHHQAQNYLTSTSDLESVPTPAGGDEPEQLESSRAVPGALLDPSAADRIVAAAADSEPESEPQPPEPQSQSEPEPADPALVAPESESVAKEQLDEPAEDAEPSATAEAASAQSLKPADEPAAEEHSAQDDDAVEHSVLATPSSAAQDTNAQSQPQQSPPPPPEERPSEVSESFESMISGGAALPSRSFPSTGEHPVVSAESAAHHASQAAPGATAAIGRPVLSAPDEDPEPQQEPHRGRAVLAALVLVALIAAAAYFAFTALLGTPEEEDEPTPPEESADPTPETEPSQEESDPPEEEEDEEDEEEETAAAEVSSISLQSGADVTSSGDAGSLAGGGSWETYSYGSSDFGGFGTTVDLLVELQETASVSEVSVDVDGSYSGGAFEVLINGDSAGSGDFSSSTNTVSVSDDTETDEVLVQISELPQQSSPTVGGMPYRLILNSIDVE